MHLNRSFFPLVFLVATLAGCAGFGGGSVQDESGQAFDPNKLPAQDELPKFSAETARNGMPNGWNFYRIAPYKRIRFTVLRVTKAELF